MSKNIYTLEIPSRKNKELIDFEVDYDRTGFIFEIRMWSEILGQFVPVNEIWLEKNATGKYNDCAMAVIMEVEHANSSENHPYIEELN